MHDTCRRLDRCGLLIASALLLLGLVVTGCSSAKPAPPKPSTIAQAQHTIEQATKLSEAENWPAAAHEWQLAADRFHLLNDRTNYAIALHNLAQAQRQLGQLTNAHRLLTEAAALNQTLGRPIDEWRNQIALLQLEAQTADTNALADRFQQLLPQSGQLQDQQGLGLFLNELGLWQQSKGELDQAAKSFQQAGEKFTALDDRFGLATVLANQGRLQELQQNYSGALGAWRGALGRFETLGEPRGIAKSLLGQGRTLLSARQDLPKAEDLLRRAARNYRLLKAPVDQENALKLLADCLSAEDKKSEADAVKAELQQLQHPPKH